MGKLVGKRGKYATFFNFPFCYRQIVLKPVIKSFPHHSSCISSGYSEFPPWGKFEGKGESSGKFNKFPIEDRFTFIFCIICRVVQVPTSIW